MLYDQPIQVDQLAQQLRHAVGDAVNDMATKAMSDQHHVIQFFAENDGGDIINEGREPHLRVEQMRTLAKSGHGGRKNLMSGSTQNHRHIAPAPTTMPCPVYQYEIHYFIFYKNSILAVPASRLK